ncbi:Ig-like domain-containing protein [Gemmata sp. JC717]|uniref:putative glycoside hydrolase n=1 Tax=Gemmata algarum TaxID=2975278 RepID=UPI0021BAAA2E|nr:putative glycoside hydrolase [Gemmata algarum]MDY3552507.1 Ig-like domain-containing protein [Gemmata algarum]
MLPLRTRLSFEPLETRENPAVLFTETFDAVSAPALPAGWATWSSDGTAALTSAAGAGTGGTPGALSQGGSRTAALAWHPQTVPADAGVSTSLRADSLVPAFVFARGSNLETSDRSYLAAVVTRGLKVQLVEVSGGTARVLGTVSSPGSSYLSGQWVRVSLVPDGATAKVEVTRADTGQYLTAAGTWQTAATSAISAATALTAAGGKVGIGRDALYSGAVALDNFSAFVADPPATPGVVTQSFDSTPAGALPAGWSGWSAGTAGGFQASPTRALSPTNGLASAGLSNTAARAWADADLPADVDVSAAVYLDSLVPAQVFARGSNLQGGTPTYYAVTLTRGLSAQLVRVVNGAETVLGSIKSTAYVSSVWVRARLVVEGDRLRVQLYRTDTRQWLTPDGSWSDSPDFVLDLRDAGITGAGKAGVGRKAAVSGALTVDDFEAKPAGQSTGPQIAVTRVNGASGGGVTGEVTFRAAITGDFERIEFRLNNQVRAVSATTPAEWTFDSTTVVNGTYTLTVRAFDSAGNVTSKEITLTVANPNMDPLPAPEIPRHYSYIRIAQLAYSGTPITGAFEQQLLRNSVDLVIPNPSYLGAIQGASPNTPQLIYSNVSNLYQGLLTSWLAYADRTGVSRELAFYHVTKATAFTGSSPSSQPVNWFWGAYQSNGTATPTDMTSAVRGGRATAASLGGAGTTTSFGYVEKFREMNITLGNGATGNWSGVWEYTTAVDASGNPTAWKALTLTSDQTAALRTSGRITFDPPKDWVPAAATPGGALLYSVRLRVTAGAAGSSPELKTIFGRDYVNANGASTGTIPAFDYAADKDHDGYLNDAEYASRQAGFDARFVYETRLFYPYYGQMRFVTNPSSSAVRHWAQEYHVQLLTDNPLADGVFMDNATGKVPFAGTSVLEPTATFAEDSGALMSAVSRAIAPRWVLANTAGGATTADAITAGSAGSFEEFLIRPMSANWSEVGDAMNLIQRRLNSPNAPYLVIDSSPEGGSRYDSRTQLATLAYYYMVADPDRSFLMFFGGDSPSSSWTEHWSPAVNVNVGAPVGSMKVFATGTDPANSALTYQVMAREYENALVLYKPLSYAQGKGEGTTGNNTATTHQLGGTYRIVNSNGTLGQYVTSITLRNGEGAILVKA